MVARSDSMFGNCYDSYSYRLWSLANVWNTCQLPPTLANGGSLIKEEELAATNLDYLIKCSQCQKGCQSFLALKEHMDSVHAETSSVSENGVGSASALSPNSLNGAGGGGGGSYHCSQCTTSFTSKDQLDKHELLHSPNAQVSCKICNKTFANVYRLQRHMISHDESAILRKFKCTECDKAFKFKHHLKEHIRIHSGEKPFECGNCGKRFSHSGSYSSHMTSKKCLVMNLKLGRTRAPNSMMDKSSRLLKRESPMNNNIPSSPEHHSYLPILPKYSDAAAAFLQSSLAANSPMTPFYLTPPALLNASHPVHSYNLPTLSQILDQIQQRVSPLRSHFLNSDNDQREKDEIDVESSNEEPPKSDTSCCGDLVMDEDRTERDDEEEENNGDLEAVKRILETVNASVTQEFLQANMQKLSSDSSNASECHSPKEPSSCNGCKKSYETPEQLNDHECEQREGLAVKLEEAVATNNNNNSTKMEETQSDQEFDVKKEEEYCESVTTTDHMSEDGRKVRVRSLISESQLKVLKDNYAINPRPKREDLEKIANSIGFPVRVVQVWFQNTRARDRREGRLVQVPYSPTTIPSVHKFVQPASPKNSENFSYDEPLDLSTKKSNSSTPSSSPPRPTSVNPQSEFCDEVVNLSSRKSPMRELKSPVPFVPYTNLNLNANRNDYGGSSSPTSEQQMNSSRLAQILAQPAHKLNLPGMGLVPMEQLMQYGVANLSQLINNNQIAGSPSPNSEKRWNDFKDNMQMDVDEDATANLSKRLKMSQYMLKSLGSPLLGNQESESEGQFVCDQCDKAFSKQSSLARHKYEHSGQRPHKCDECPKAFKHKHHLTEHKRLHSGEKPFQCSKCLKRFSHSGSYSQHMNHRFSYCKPYRE